MAAVCHVGLLKNAVCAVTAFSTSHVSMHNEHIFILICNLGEESIIDTLCEMILSAVSTSESDISRSLQSIMFPIRRRVTSVEQSNNNNEFGTRAFPGLSLIYNGQRTLNKYNAKIVCALCVVHRNIFNLPFLLLRLT